MKRTITALAVGGLLLVGGCSSANEPARAEATTTATKASVPLTTADEFLAAAEALTPTYKPCADEIGTPACVAAAAKGDALTSDIMLAAKAMPGGWPKVVAATRKILDASTMTSQGCKSGAASGGTTRMTDCLDAMGQMDMASADVTQSVNATVGGW
ncbi:hypothetical protein [Rhodococcus sp. ACT016]|uniref:hypothetical protein n=1 Tax=Rhodococcus sp. ACT016 TaxID=3134808 RepID=UPI003D2CF83A